MINRRSQGLLHLHGLVVALFLPLLFLLLLFLAADVFHRLNYNMVNVPLYLFGVVVAAVVNFNFYNDRLLSNNGSLRRAEAFRITNLQTMLLALAFFALIFATKDQAISRIFVSTYILSSWLSLLTINITVPPFFASRLFRGGHDRNCLLIGDLKGVQRLEGWLKGKALLGLNVVGYLTFNPDSLEEDTPVTCFGGVDQLASVLEKFRVSQVILLENPPEPETVPEVVKLCEEQGARLLIFNTWARLFPQPLITVQEGEETFFSLQEEPLESPYNRLLKRGLDVIIALWVVVIILPPLMVLVKIIQHYQSPGPLFHVQSRRGLARQYFNLLKFRSMHCEGDDRPEQRARQATRDDPRIYPFGRWMRRFSIDEFPQFINVLLGQMSVVGPRPHLPEHDALFAGLVRQYPQRHFVKPGITGLAQSLGYRGEITDVSMLSNRIRLDLDYMARWSLWLDIEIILKTLWQVFIPPRQAY